MNTIMKSIYGTVGYTVLKKYNSKVIIMADMHDTLSECDSDIDVSDWFKSKFNSSEILLEEVPRGDVVLQELWSHSPHTQKLKDLFLNNPKIIKGVDIRPFMVPFSWEIVKESDNKNMSLLLYLNKVDLFFCVKDQTLLLKLPNYNIDKLKGTILGKHFLKIKKNFYSYCLKHMNLFNKSMIYLFNNHPNILEEVNDILSGIMEWYICALIDLNKTRPIILHTGLAHSEKIVEWLIQNYGYSTLIHNGINKISELDSGSMNGCMVLPGDIDSQFGGFINYLNYLV